MIWIKKEEAVIKRGIIKTEKLVWNYKNLILFCLSIFVAITILKSDFIKSFILGLNDLNYLGVFISGLFFSYGLTTAPAISMLYLFSRTIHPVDVAVFGAIGAFISDYLIFRFIKYGLFDEIKMLADRVKFHPHLNKTYIKILKKLSPLIAGIIIASPLPDEVAASILGSIKVNDKEFILISLISNFIGILIISLL